MQFCHQSGKNKIHMYVWAAKDRLYNFGDSAYKSNAFIFACKTVIAQYKDEWGNSC